MDAPFSILADYFWHVFVILFVIALWEEFYRERNKTKADLNNLLTEVKSLSPFGFVQRILDYLFNKFAIRQLLNPYFFFPLSILLSAKIYSEKPDNIDALILFITFLALMWYARETFAMRKEQQKQNRLLIGRPLIVIAKEIGNFISIKNVGNNIARDIHIVIGGLENEIIKNFLIVGIEQKIIVAIDQQLSSRIDACHPNLLVSVEYKNFQRSKGFRTIYKPDKEMFIETGIGRFDIVEDTANPKDYDHNNI